MKPEIDLGAAMTYATADPDWMRKSLIAGVGGELTPVLPLGRLSATKRGLAQIGR